jgi:hypothetical protein
MAEMLLDQRGKDGAINVSGLFSFAAGIKTKEKTDKSYKAKGLVRTRQAWFENRQDMTYRDASP